VHFSFRFGQLELAYARGRQPENRVRSDACHTLQTQRAAVKLRQGPLALSGLRGAARAALSAASSGEEE